LKLRGLRLPSFRFLALRRLFPIAILDFFFRLLATDLRFFFRAIDNLPACWLAAA
jgi:hypothetical protein